MGEGGGVGWKEEGPNEDSQSRPAGQTSERMRTGGSEVGSVCPNWLTELLKYPCSNYSHKDQLLATERSHWATFVHTGRQQTTGFMFV